MTRRIAHTSQHRGQLLAMLRMLGRNLHRTYGPTADTGGLMQNHAPTLYAYPSTRSVARSRSPRRLKSFFAGAQQQTGHGTARIGLVFRFGHEAAHRINTVPILYTGHDEAHEIYGACARTFTCSCGVCPSKTPTATQQQSRRPVFP